MTQGFQKVRPGQPYSGFPAQTYNAMIDVINAYRSGQLTNTDNSFDVTRSSGIVEIVNGSGSDRNQFDILGVSEPIILPVDDEDEYKTRVRLRCVTPDGTAHEQNIVILQQPIKNGQVGLAVAAGVTQCRIQVDNTSLEHAFPVTGDMTKLVAGDAGVARILWKESGTGTKNAIIRIDAQLTNQIRIVSVKSSTGQSCIDKAVPATGEVYDAFTQALFFLTIPPLTVDDEQVWLARTNCSPNLPFFDAGAKERTFLKDERVVAMRVGRYNPGSGERDLYVALDPAIGFTKVNKNDKLDYLEDQYAHKAPPGFTEGDLRVRMETLVVNDDPKIANYVTTTGYNPTVEQAIIHDAGTSQSGQPANPVWRAIIEQRVVTDMRLTGSLLEKRTALVKVLGVTDEGWSTAFPSTECP